MAEAIITEAYSRLMVVYKQAHKRVLGEKNKKTGEQSCGECGARGFSQFAAREIHC